MPSQNVESLHNFEYRWLGRNIPYDQVHDLMKELLAQRIDGKIPDTLLLVEHQPVYTVGRARNAMQNIFPQKQVPVLSVERGGDVTYHGPGQLTGYPIVQLPREDLHGYLRFLEDFWIEILAEHQITAHRDERNTGVWVHNQKMVAIGIAMRRWVCWHGFACNLTVDLQYFQQCNPCGMSSDLVTRWMDHQSPPDMEDFAHWVGKHFCQKWQNWVQNTKLSVP